MSYWTPLGTGTGWTTVVPWPPAVFESESTATNAVTIGDATSPEALRQHGERLVYTGDFRLDF